MVVGPLASCTAQHGHLLGLPLPLPPIVALVVALLTPLSRALAEHWQISIQTSVDLPGQLTRIMEANILNATLLSAPLPSSLLPPPPLNPVSSPFIDNKRLHSLACNARNPFSQRFARLSWREFVCVHYQRKATCLMAVTDVALLALVVPAAGGVEEGAARRLLLPLVLLQQARLECLCMRMCSSEMRQSQYCACVCVWCVPLLIVASRLLTCSSLSTG